MKFITGSSSKALTIKSSNNPGNTEIMMRGSEREVMSYKQPTQELGMTDLIKQHTPGERFMYAAISHKADDNKGALLSRLIRHTPTYNKSPLPEKKLPCIPLYEEVETFPLSSIVGKSGKAYIHVVEVLIVFAPLVAPDSDYTKVKMAIVDNRFIDKRSIVKSFTAATNIVSKGSLQLSYCFPRSEVSEIQLVVSRDAAFLQGGSQWGVIQLQISLEDMDFPIQVDIQNVNAINDIVAGLLDDPEVSPNHIDVSASENDRIRLRDLYLSGDMRDSSEPIEGKSEVTKYAKSVLSKPKGKEIKTSAPGWEFMNGARRTGKAGDNSVEPSEDGFDVDRVSLIDSEIDRGDGDTSLIKISSPAPPYPLKSAMKKSRFADQVEDMNRVVEVDDVLNEPVNPFS
jgi:hypothetical protein